MATSPYPWPYGGDLDPRRLALVVVGAQDWGPGAVDRPEDALSALARVGKVVRDAGGVVVLVRHDLPAVRAARSGPVGELLVEPEPADVVVGAGGLNAFFAGPLDAVLRDLGRDHLAVGGLGLETAVYSTVGGANDRGYECITLVDASAPHDPAVGERAVASITMSGGIFGAVGTTADLCDHLTKEDT